MSEDLENLELFIQEVEESLELLESGLLELEQKGPVAELIDSVFRAAHTIKGGARLMGFPNIEKLSHHMEESLDKVRAGELDLSSAMISLLLKSADAIRTGTSHLMEHQQESDEAFDALLDDLAACSRGELMDAPAEVKAEEPEPKVEPETEAEEEEFSETEEDWGGEGDWEDEQIEVPKQVIQQSKAETITNEVQANAQKSRVKIDVDSLDKIMNLVGELVLCRNQLKQLTQDDLNPSVHTTVGTISAITSELQERVMDTRMLQVGTLFSRYHRVVRDLSQKLNKKVQLVVESQEAELDRNMLEALKDPLSHLVNNAMDHALESPDERKNSNKSPEGKIILNSYHEGGQVVIEVRDDGRGFDIEKIKKRLLEKKLESEEVLSKMKEEDLLQRVFQPGFSTLDEATMVSGRGVGLDVVKSNITSIGGQVTIHSIAGQGSVFKLHIPLTLAVIPAITVETDEQIFAIPQSNLQELICLNKSDFSKIEKMDEVETYRLRGHLLPLIRLRELIGSDEIDRDQCFILVLICGDQRFGLIVDEIRDMEEIVVKPLSVHLKNIDLFLGSTLLGNGDIALILDVVGVGAKKNVNPTDSAVTNNTSTFRTKTASSALLFTIGGSETFAIQMSQVRRLEEIKKSDIEYTGHRQVIQYRGDIMPLLELHEFIDVDHQEVEGDDQSLIVVGYKEKEVALKVNQIVDSIIFEGELNTTVVDDPCILGTMMIQNQPFLLIDAIQVFDQAFRSPLQDHQEPRRGERVLYVDDSSFFLKVVHKYLDEAGYDIVTEISSKKALNMVKKESFDLMLVDLEMPEVDGFEFIQKVKEIPELVNVPIVVLSSITSEHDKQYVRDLGAQDYLVKIDKEELLSTIEKQLAKEVVLA
jgi:two-component system chemotaxis sensor kinase CheA